MPRRPTPTSVPITGEPAATDAAVDNAAFLAGCPHFLNCGGCIDVSPKFERLPVALATAGFATETVPIDISAPNTRRRMDLAMRRAARGVELGLHRHRSHEIVDLQTCRVLHPDLVALFDPLRAVLDRTELLRDTGSVVANQVDNGIDLLLRTELPATQHDRTRLADFATRHGIARVSHAIGNGAPETLALIRAPEIRFSGVVVHPPPGGFLQATAQGEAAIIAAVLAGLPLALRPRARIAELYAGSGTLTFALAARGRVDAFEGDAATHAALDQACRNGGLAGRVVANHRDLVRQPLMARELEAYDVVVLDPPAAGAAIQVRQIADGKVPCIIYVSCDQQSLARDARMLRSFGYVLHGALAVDQFIGSPRVESVCVFRGLKRQYKRPI